MLKLCIDGAGDTGLLALGRSKECLAYTEVFPAHNTDRVAQYLEALQQILAQCSCSAEDLTAIYVVEGPGRYTGIRLGMALAQGLALANSTQLYGLQRQTAYASLMSAPKGLFLCESGRAHAYGGIWQEGECAALVLLSETQALAYQAHTILSLLAPASLQQQYPQLMTQTRNILTLKPSDRAAALLASSMDSPQFVAIAHYA